MTALKWRPFWPLVVCAAIVLVSTELSEGFLIDDGCSCAMAQCFEEQRRDSSSTGSILTENMIDSAIQEALKKSDGRRSGKEASASSSATSRTMKISNSGPLPKQCKVDTEIDAIFELGNLANLLEQKRHGEKSGIAKISSYDQEGDYDLQAAVEAINSNNYDTVSSGQEQELGKELSACLEIGAADDATVRTVAYDADTDTCHISNELCEPMVARPTTEWQEMQIGEVCGNDHDLRMGSCHKSVEDAYNGCMMDKHRCYGIVEDFNHLKCIVHGCEPSTQAVSNDALSSILSIRFSGHDNDPPPLVLLHSATLDGPASCLYECIGEQQCSHYRGFTEGGHYHCDLFGKSTDASPPDFAVAKVFRQNLESHRGLYSAVTGTEAGLSLFGSHPTKPKEARRSTERRQPSANSHRRRSTAATATSDCRYNWLCEPYASNLVNSGRSASDIAEDIADWPIEARRMLLAAIRELNSDLSEDILNSEKKVHWDDVDWSSGPTTHDYPMAHVEASIYKLKHQHSMCVVKRHTQARFRVDKLRSVKDMDGVGKGKNDVVYAMEADCCQAQGKEITADNPVWKDWYEWEWIEDEGESEGDEQFRKKIKIRFDDVDSFLGLVIADHDKLAKGDFYVENSKVGQKIREELTSLQNFGWPTIEIKYDYFQIGHMADWRNACKGGSSEAVWRVRESFYDADAGVQVVALCMGNLCLQDFDHNTDKNAQTVIGDYSSYTCLKDRLPQTAQWEIVPVDSTGLAQCSGTERYERDEGTDDCKANKYFIRNRSSKNRPRFPSSTSWTPTEKSTINIRSTKEVRLGDEVVPTASPSDDDINETCVAGDDTDDGSSGGDTSSSASFSSCVKMSACTSSQVHGTDDSYTWRATARTTLHPMPVILYTGDYYNSEQACEASSTTDVGTHLGFGVKNMDSGTPSPLCPTGMVMSGPGGPCTQASGNFKLDRVQCSYLDEWKMNGNLVVKMYQPIAGLPGCAVGAVGSIRGRTGTDWDNKMCKDCKNGQYWDFCGEQGFEFEIGFGLGLACGWGDGPVKLVMGVIGQIKLGFGPFPMAPGRQSLGFDFVGDIELCLLWCFRISARFVMKLGDAAGWNKDVSDGKCDDNMFGSHLSVEISTPLWFIGSITFEYSEGEDVQDGIGNDVRRSDGNQKCVEEIVTHCHKYDQQDNLVSVNERTRRTEGRCQNAAGFMSGGKLKPQKKVVAALEG